MSAYVPYDIQVNIIKKIHPVKSLIRFRSVSKQWKSLIDNSEFITHHHSLNQTHPHHLLVRYEEASEDYKFVSIVDDDSFPQNKFFHTVKQDSIGSLVGSSHGLVCINVSKVEGINKMTQIIVWNPTIRKSVRIHLPGTFYILGFGVCPKTGDPKIVKITRNTLSTEYWKAEVFRLSTMTWRNVPINLPLRPFLFSYGQVVVDGVIYWINYMFYGNHMITFDLTSEEFGEIELPESVAHSPDVYIIKLKESVVVVNHCIGDVWMMLKNDSSKSSFAKLFTFKTGGTIGFRNNGQLIMIQLDDNDVVDKQLKACEPNSECYTGLGIYGSSFEMTSYTESLLLLNHSDSITTSA